MKENKAILFVLWITFISTIFIYTFFVFITKGFPFTIEPYLSILKNIFNLKPQIISILYLIGIAEFIVLIVGKHYINTLFKSLYEMQKLMIIWGIAEVIAIFGLIGSFLANNGTLYPPLGLLSLIAIIYHSPSKNNEKQNSELPYTVE